MAATDLAITLGAVLEWQAPGGAVRLAQGGVVKFDPGTGLSVFDSEHPVFGSIVAFDAFESAIDDQVEAGRLTFAPATEAALSDWWRVDLENTALRVWIGEIDPGDGVTLTAAELVADWIVDTALREQGEGSDLLSLESMTRQERMFLMRQGNVCSDTFHQTVFPGERGFENCTDGQRFFAWGTDSPPAPSMGGAGGNGGGGGGGGNGFPNINLF